MKTYFVLLTIFLAISSTAQIKLEHTYQNSFPSHGLVEVDSGVFRYVFYNSRDTVSVYRLDHSLDRLIVLPFTDAGYLTQISKRLFDLDEEYECMIVGSGNQSGIKVYKENGDIIFGCQQCQLLNSSLMVEHMNAPGNYPAGIINTDQGTKMVIDYYDNNNMTQTAVFSLPGRVPGSTVKLGVLDRPSTIDGSSFPTSAYPNPSSDKIRIEYQLPEGVTRGELIIVDVNGKQIGRYQ